MINKAPNRFRDYVKYSSIAFQMMFIILLGTFGGFKLDEYAGFRFPVFTLILSLTSVFVALYIALKDFIKKK